MRYFISIISFLLLLSACTTDVLPENEKLPILGFRDIDSTGDTIYHSIPDFSFIDQDSQEVTNKTFEGKVYISDFFFIHCPSICPKVKAQMMRIYDKYEDNDKVILLSHSIDTKNDTIPALKIYANKLEAKTEKWHFVTGEHDLIYSLADEYFVAALVNKDAPGGFDHSGRIILVDKKRNVRSFAEGTDPESVTKFMLDIDKLLAE
ncbi:MAG: protein SCO1/2 [Saprospiraceae bacterium]|jgi:protein SCO1/2